MTKFLLAAFAALLMVSSAYAGSNIKQKASGATVWQDADGDEVPVGDSGLTVRMDDVSTAGTTHVVSHKSGKITKIYAVLNTTLSAQSDNFVLSFAIGSDTQYTPISTGATITSSATSVGTVDSVSPNDVSVNVGVGDAIAIITDGGSTGTAPATITIVIE